MRLKTVVAAAVAALAFACEPAAPKPEPELATSARALATQSCLDQLLSTDGGGPQLGTPAWATALEACIQQLIAQWDGGFPSGGDGGSSACVAGFSCVNGACSCTSGAKAGQTCQQATCATDCKSCQ